MVSKPKAIPLLATLLITIISSLTFSAQVQADPAPVDLHIPAATWPTLSTTLIASDLVNPLLVANANDGSGRLFIVEQVGRIRIFTNTLLTQPFLDIRDRVLYGGERGLLSVAFPPDYSNKGYFYVYYTNKNGDNQVSRFHLGNSQNQADPNSEEIILPLAHPNQSNHNGGQLAFGPDGYLYIGTGDGGGSGDPYDNAQNPNSLLGKILRIDVERTPTPPVTASHMVFLPLSLRDQTGNTSTLPYSIPSDNPFVRQPGYRPEIWALGMRNPWRFGFDRQTGDLYIGDVGQNSREEVDFQPAGSSGGQNYGWNVMEGLSCYNTVNCDKAGLTLPVFDYPTHFNGTCAVTGGYVYRGSDFPSMQGIYFFGDYCQGIIRGLQLETGNWVEQNLLPTGLNILGFGEDEQGGLYLAAVDSAANGNKGRVYQITASP